MLRILMGFLEFVMLLGVIGGAIDLAKMEKKARHAYLHQQVKLGDINNMLGVKNK